MNTSSRSQERTCCLDTCVLISSMYNSPMTVGSRSTYIALGTWRPELPVLKNVLNGSSRLFSSAGASRKTPSGPTPCSRQKSSQQAFPVCTPAWPTWMEMHSLCAEKNKKLVEVKKNKRFIWVPKRIILQQGHLLHTYINQGIIKELPQTCGDEQFNYILFVLLNVYTVQCKNVWWYTWCCLLYCDLLSHLAIQNVKNRLAVWYQQFTVAFPKSISSCHVAACWGFQLLFCLEEEHQPRWFSAVEWYS